MKNLKTKKMKKLSIFFFVLTFAINVNCQVNLIKDVYKAGTTMVSYNYFTDTTGAYIQYDYYSPNKNI